MSDDDREIDIESDEEDDDQDNISLNSDLTGRETSAEKRAHHNALERKRRDHIKESFTSLRDSVPTIQGEKVVKHTALPLQASRAQILKKATEYIQIMKQRNHKHQQEIDDIRSQNRILEQQVSALEKVKSAGAFAANQSGQAADSDSGASEETVPARPRRKKAKV